ncbi:ribosomal protein S18-alanine N-acetyltransferase [Proteiniclasticum sp. C24MP]|uniref:ribosomal protein S18-alanine N-acetyltransferase n=1 Tax=Proteiniclasticum sp. C24MP TaxID=3374101 RepID=UPI003754A174
MVEIKEMQPQHVNEVFSISAAAFPLPWAKDELIRETINPNALNLVALYEEKVIGYVQCWYTLDSADIINVAVSDAFKRQGVGHRLIRDLILHLKERNVENVFLEVRVSNLPAQRLYKSMGFITLSKRERYYVNGEDALVMNLQI